MLTSLHCEKRHKDNKPVGDDLGGEPMLSPGPAWSNIDNIPDQMLDR